MPETIDVYRQWLKIEETSRPLNHYQLLKLKVFEDDAGKIREHYRKINEHVRKFATGQYSEQSQKLLNELAKAMLCLTDAGRKSEYDITLGRKDKARERKTLEQILLASNAIDQAKLTRARNYSNVVGVDVRDALIQQKLAPPEVVMQAYAESVGRPYVDLKETGVDELVVKKVPAILARQHSCVPVMIDEENLLMASPNLLAPDIEDELRLRIGITVRTVLCTAADVNQFVDKYYPKEAAEAELKAAQGGAKTDAKAEKKAAAKGADEPKSPAQSQRQRIMVAIIVFCWGFMAIMAWKTSLFMEMNAIPWWAIPFGLLVGAGAAALTYAIMMKFGK